MIHEERYCRCIYISHCDRRPGCKLNAGGSVNEGGGVCAPRTKTMTKDEKTIRRLQDYIRKQEKTINDLSEELSRTRDTVLTLTDVIRAAGVRPEVMKAILLEEDKP